MSGFGSFSQEAYQQLQEAYSAQLLAADESEAAGVQVGSEKFSVETSAAPSPWLEKTGLWQYPSGRGDHLDIEQKQQDLLAALQNQEEDEEEETTSDLDSLTEDELDELIDKVLSEIEEDEDEDEEEAGKTAEEIAAEIEALKAELAELAAVTEEEEEEDEEETDSEESPIEEEEEDSE
jgi:hypothetical protein